MRRRPEPGPRPTPPFLIVLVGLAALAVGYGLAVGEMLLWTSTHLRAAR